VLCVLSGENLQELTMTAPLYGGIEGGGTKFVCAVGTGPDDLRAETRFPTTTPQETIARAVEFLHAQEHVHGKLAAVGIGMFGPVDLNPKSPTWGTITSTPKPGWAQANFAQAIREALQVPVGFDTDVNAAALGEGTWGAARGLDTYVYLTIGTGIGGGGVVGGQLIHGALHSEMGHMHIPHDWKSDPFPGSCPFHADCLEGLATGPAMEKRWGARAETLPLEHPAWALEANYLALALVNLICVLSPQRIILGGGVMSQAHMFPMIRRRVQELLNGYLQFSQVLQGIEAYIMPPELGGRAGVLGAIALARQVNR
jgi:fructokinase